MVAAARGGGVGGTAPRRLYAALRGGDRGLDPLLVGEILEDCSPLLADSVGIVVPL